MFDGQNRVGQSISPSLALVTVGGVGLGLVQYHCEHVDLQTSAVCGCVGSNPLADS